jgi:hypothetical protein
MSLNYSDLVSGGCCDASNRSIILLPAVRRGSSLSFSISRFTQVAGIRSPLNLSGAFYSAQLFDGVSSSPVAAFSFAVSGAMQNQVVFTLSAIATLALIADKFYVGDIVETLLGGAPTSIADTRLLALSQRSA